MKRLLALTLCVGLIFGIAGCRRKETPASLEKKLTQQLIDAKYLSGDISGNAKMTIDNMGEQTFTLAGTFQSDISTGYPKFKLDGNISLGEAMSLPLSLYSDENNSVITLFGQTQTTGVSEDKKNRMKTVIEQLSAHQVNLSRSVTETSRNEKKALEIHYDINQLNTLLSVTGNGDTSIEQLTLFYILKEDNSIEQIDGTLIINKGQRTEINFSILFSSINEPFEITPNTD